MGLESTVLSLAEDPPELLRPGAVTIEALRSAIGPIAKGRALESAPRSPGMLKRHYAPRTPIVFRGSIAPSAYPARVGLICFERGSAQDFPYSIVRELTSNGDLELAAANLFETLRELDGAALDLIVVDECPENGMGMAIMDRLRRAAHAPGPETGGRN